jgi:hypothetical protein
MVFNATFNNISVISWRSDLLVRKPEYPQKTTIYRKLNTKRFKIPKGQSKAVYRRTDNTVAKRKEIILLLVMSRSSKRCYEFKYFCRPGESFDVSAARIDIIYMS